MKRGSLFYDSSFMFAILFLISIISLFDIKKVRGPSMLSAFKENEVLFIFKAMYGLRSPFFNRYLLRWGNVQKGDVVIFKIGGRYIMKRCYATDADVIYFYQKNDDRATKYFMRIEETEIELREDAYYRLFMDCQISEFEGVQAVPKNCLLLLGDNTVESFDCRDYGYITKESILGKVIK